MSDLDEVVSEFLVESHENLDQLDRDLLALEEDPFSPGTLASVFRTFHTIKGTCGFLGYGNLERVTHASENLLSLLRDGTLSLSPPPPCCTPSTRCGRCWRRSRRPGRTATATTLT